MDLEINEKTSEPERGSGILILDYGTGNLSSIRRALDRIGAGSFISSSPNDVRSASRIILPGIGHFGKAMCNLKSLGLVDELNEAVLQNGVPVLGICLGMEIMARYGEEGDLPGLGWIDAEVARFDVSDTNRFKVPHMGWNTVERMKDSRLMNNVDPTAEFYFGHSYHLRHVEPCALLGNTEYQYRFCSAVERGNIFGVQFHPEKSHEAGEQILRNFIGM